MIMTREGANIYDRRDADDPVCLYTDKGYIPWGGTLDSLILGDVVAFGYFLIIACQLFGYMCAEISMVQNFLLNIVGSCCYLAVGSVHIQYFSRDEDYLKEHEKAYQSLSLANASLAIIQGILLLGDAGYCAYQIIKD